MLWVVWPVLAPGSYITSFDTVAYSGPNLDLTLRAVRAGSLAHWNPAIYEGIPHLANMHAASLYPLKWLFAWFGVHQAWDLIIASHTMILGAGMFWLVRGRLGLRAPAGLVATVAVVGSGMVMVRMLFFEQILVIAWTPWLLGCIDAVVRSGPEQRGRRIGALAVVTGLTLVAGHSQLVYESIPLVAVWACARAADDRRAKPLLDVAVGGVLGGLLACPQLLPTAILAGRSANSGGRDLSGAVSSPAYSVQGRRVLATLLGDLFAKVHTVASDGYENLTFVGAVVATLALAGAFVVVSRRSTRWTGVGLIALGGGALLLSLGPRTFVYRAAFRLVPGFDEARVPARWSIITVVVVALLAAWATDALAGHRPVGPTLVAGRRAGVTTSLQRTAIFTTVGVVVTAAVAAVGPFHLPPGRTLAAWTVGAAAVATAWWLAAAKRPRLAVAAVPAVLAMVELGTMNLHSAARAARLPQPYTDYRSTVVDQLAAQGDRVFALTADRLDDFRYLATSLRPNANVSFDVRSLDGYDGGIQVTRRWADAVAELAGHPILPEQPLRSQLSYPLDPAAFARFGVHWLLLDRDLVDASVAAPGWRGPIAEDGALAVFENPRYRGDARLVVQTVPAGPTGPSGSGGSGGSGGSPGAGRSTGAGGSTGAGSQAASATPQDDAAIVEGDGPALRCGAPCPAIWLAVARPSATHLRLELPAVGGEAGAQLGSSTGGEAQEPAGAAAALAVIAEQWDRGWHATVDGTPARVIPVDGSQIGVELPAGATELELRYRTPGLALGLTLAGAAGAVVAGLVLHRTSSRREGPPFP